MARQIIASKRANSYQFQVFGIAMTSSPDSFSEMIPIEGWVPVDTNFKTQDIPSLISKLGGERLYGRHPFVAVRELIQNGLDAMSLRQVVDPKPKFDPLIVELTDNSGTHTLRIIDTDVGMGPQEIIERLLSFGKSGWLNDRSIGEFNHAFPHKSAITGEFGIGFFSSFMVADRISVKSRRFDEDPSDTTFLEFNNGLHSRPILRKATGMERQTLPGTTVELTLRDDVASQKGTIGGIRSVPYPFSDLQELYVASEFPIVFNLYGEETSVDGSHWRTEKPGDFMTRIDAAMKHTFAQHYPVPEEMVRPIYAQDGSVIGRGAFLATSHLLTGQKMGAIVSGGRVVHAMEYFRGVIIGHPTTVLRDEARPIASRSEYVKWATEQVPLLKKHISDGEVQAHAASELRAMGIDVQGLKVARFNDKYVNIEELKKELDGLNSLWVTCEMTTNEWPNRKKATSKISPKSVLYLPPNANWGSSYYSELEGKFALLSDCLNILRDAFAIEQGVFDVLSKVFFLGKHTHRSLGFHGLNPQGGKRVYSGIHVKQAMTISDLSRFKKQ